MNDNNDNNNSDIIDRFNNELIIRANTTIFDTNNINNIFEFDNIIPYESSNNYSIIEDIYNVTYCDDEDKIYDIKNNNPLPMNIYNQLDIINTSITTNDDNENYSDSIDYTNIRNGDVILLLYNESNCEINFPILLYRIDDNETINQYPNYEDYRERLKWIFENPTKTLNNANVIKKRIFMVQKL